MLDVHAPHHTANSVRDFFLHLFTITIGLLIAVGIEGLVERHQHREIAEVARKNLRVEIMANANSLSKTLANLDKLKYVMANNLSEVQRMKQTDDTHIMLNGTYQITHLQQTAWRTAEQTGALAFMPYEEAQRFSDIYSSQQQFLELEPMLLKDSANFFGIVRRVSPGTRFRDNDYADLGELFGSWQLLLFNLDLAAKEALDQDRAYLEGRTPRTSFNEGLPE